MTETEERPYHHGSLRDALLSAAERTLRAQGQDELSLRELARQIGVSHAAPRRHFRDRQALLDALAITGFERLGAKLEAAIEAADDVFASRLHDAVGAFVRFATQDAALLELMFSTKHRDGAEEVREAASAAFATLPGLIEQGQAEGLLAAGTSSRAGIVLLATVQGIATLINGGMVEAERLDELVDAAVEQFLRGNRPD
ncbi:MULTISPECIES: TetR/AcrR family transcriptional regulator [Brachybacterium]|uniref:TetR family transcriptional regulator n=2 Tax=Brachybacterium TaxID=43668 RepID=A0A3R8X5P7_9MICO|nr:MULTISPECIES: TetR/AcrR family transcriptional regulator [Brachybacterium]MCT1435757.1 TetR/AcrR family transcriptional regulator [Brachybacterium paraconglomeratum]RRR18467.1 TetR family transcriptional regulator [Brachybacterium paraconglomeratum]GLI30111.1 TetR family transcriptional regulator [Brachybacterium conglomeratum]GLK04649.1 TetR family transcriptional regulator [Brachybacterium conglomeratum]